MTQTVVSGIEEALRLCGVTERSLAPREKDDLDRLGYVVLPGVIDRKRLAGLRGAFESAVAQGKRHGQHVHLPCLDAVFDDCHTPPKVLAAVYHVFPALSRVPAGRRDPLPGHGLQALHPDWGRAAASRSRS